MSGKLLLLKPLLVVLPLLAVTIPAAMAEITAGPSGELTVKGQYIPGACLAVLANNGTIDYGHIQSSSLNNSTTTDLPVKVLPSAITITCPEATSVAYSTVDNRTSSVIQPANLAARYALMPSPVELDPSAPVVFNGLGTDAANNSIGNYQARFINPKVDGQPGHLSNQTGIFVDSAMSYEAANLSPVEFEGMGTNFYLSGAQSTIAVAKVFVLDYEVQASIEPASNLDLSQTSTLDGSITVSLYYL